MGPIQNILASFVWCVGFLTHQKTHHIFLNPGIKLENISRAPESTAAFIVVTFNATTTTGFWSTTAASPTITTATDKDHQHQERYRSECHNRNVTIMIIPAPPLLSLCHARLEVDNLVPFLDASSHLYNRVCPSVGPSVRRSVRPSVRPSVGLTFVKNKGIQYFRANKCQRSVFIPS